ncbi:hypothetical protein V9T40_003512 [Parthenolecanium corni]|uniref:THAP-type domain-containing protein n=1 Tax=Parthenolecanium corni TaxID=536013 RepID=A0AAN9Y817_9HEMI
MKRDKWTPTKYSKLCSNHFSSDSYETSGWSSKPKLKSDAVPTMFQFPKHLQKPEKLRKSPNLRKHKIKEAMDLLLQSKNTEQNENSLEVENVPKPKRPRLCYLGDLQKHMAEESEAKPENFLAYANLTEKILEKKNKQIKCLQQKNQRLNKRFENLQSLVSDLLEKNLITDEIAQSVIV